MTRFEKRVAKMRKEYLAKVKIRDERLAEEQEKARLAELRQKAQEAGVEGYEKMSAEQLEKALADTENDGGTAQLEKLTVDELKAFAKEKGLTGYSDMKKDELIEAIKAVG